MNDLSELCSVMLLKQRLCRIQQSTFWKEMNKTKLAGITIWVYDLEKKISYSQSRILNHRERFLEMSVIFQFFEIQRLLPYNNNYFKPRIAVIFKNELSKIAQKWLTFPKISKRFTKIADNLKNEQIFHQKLLIFLESII